VLAHALGSPRAAGPSKSRRGSSAAQSSGRHATAAAAAARPGARIETLKALILARTGVGDAAAADPSAAEAATRSLARLRVDLSNNSVADAGATAFARALRCRALAAADAAAVPHDAVRRGSQDDQGIGPGPGPGPFGPGPFQLILTCDCLGPGGTREVAATLDAHGGGGGGGFTVKPPGRQLPLFPPRVARPFPVEGRDL
jgi:hypothetical protein